MEEYNLVHYSSFQNLFSANEFEEALHHAKLHYSIRHLARSGIRSEENIVEALRQSMRVCSLAGVNAHHHFKKIYIFDASTGVTYIDWLMSKEGFNLMIMQFPSLNEPIARRLWKLLAQQA